MQVGVGSIEEMVVSSSAKHYRPSFLHIPLLYGSSPIRGVLWPLELDSVALADSISPDTVITSGNGFIAS